MAAAPTFAQVQKLEGLAHSMTVARDRKRRGLMLHLDELPALIEAVGLAARLADEARLAALPPAGAS